MSKAPTVYDVAGLRRGRRVRSRRRSELAQGLNVGVHESGVRGNDVYVLLHGIGVSHRYFDRLQRVLERHARVISLDLPGFGGTAKPARALSVERYATAIARTLGVLGVSRCVVVGHSMGAQFAVELARHKPDLVSHVVLIGPVVDARRRSAIEQAVDLARDSLGEPPSANLIVFSDYLRCGPLWYSRELRPMLEYPIEERVALLPHPVLVIRGSRDPIAKDDWCARLSAAARRGELVTLPGPHVIQHSDPVGVARSISAFVA